jgi:glycosyltransferase involved in cell wall biosynthesis
MQPELKVKKILGRTYLNENRLAEALDVFSQVLAADPDDLETLLILGNFYLASGDGRTAKKLYLHAQQVDPENKTIACQIAMAEEMPGTDFEELDPTDLRAVARLLQRLTGKSKVIHESDILQAALLLEKIINSENPAELVSEHLDEIDELLPALLELNICQAYSDGRYDLAEGLRNLQVNIDYQFVAQPEETSPEVKQGFESKHFTGNLLLLLPNLGKKTQRMTLLKPALEACGCRVIEKGAYVAGRDAKPDLVLTSNPHLNPRLSESLSALAAAGVPIVLDLDTDFEKQPVSHPEYSTQGLGNQARSNAYTSALALARLVTVPSEMQSVELKPVVEQVCVIPDGWSRQNRLWEKESHPRETINLGWVGTGGQLEDLVSIRRYIIRIMREFPKTRIVIIGNPQAYRLFDSLPENRRLYLPMVAHEEFPYLLSQLDMLLVPLRNLPYNLSLPDTLLMEAGARGLPWIASPTPAFRCWPGGGILCEELDEWHLNLRHLVMDRELRSSLGKAGRRAAQSREMNQLGKLWLEMLDQVAQAEAVASSSLSPAPVFSSMES